MKQTPSLLEKLSKDCREQFLHRQSLLSFPQFLDLVRDNPRPFMRHAAEYIRDTFDHFGAATPENALGHDAQGRFKIFDIGSERVGTIVGGEHTQAEIYRILQSFVRQGRSTKLILLHGPNGSAKSSTIEAIGHAMQLYSETDEGAVYRFNWVFPLEKAASTGMKGESARIGFDRAASEAQGLHDSFALLDESLISCKLPCEFKDNPLFLLPMPQREAMLREWTATREKAKPDETELPPHILLPGLSKKNQLILENLMTAYEGDFAKVMRHVQIERFYFSRPYRVGISTVEPQMSVDAQERQLTMDKNVSNLPPILHNIRFTEVAGELVEANRGILEFSDMLKRPIEAFKYLLSTVEKGAVNLPSSTANLDVVFFGTTNDKHLDGFKGNPDFGSFRGRFELVTAPYLLRPSEEAQIYAADIEAISKTKPVAPHTCEMLALWASQTRLRQPEVDYYEPAHRALIERLTPRLKIRLYENQPLGDTFTPQEEAALRALRDKIYDESRGTLVYEGRFGASPREIRMMLHHAAGNPETESITPVEIFGEIERLIKDRSAYEFLQYETRGGYHDVAAFLQSAKDEFAQIFHEELLSAMSLIDKEQHATLLARYVEHVVASLKKEKIYNPTTQSHEPPSESLMSEVEKLLGVTSSVSDHRQGLLARLAAWRLENKSKALDLSLVFAAERRKIERHYFDEKEELINATRKAMLALDTDEAKHFAPRELELARATYKELERRFHYTSEAARKLVAATFSRNPQ